MDPLPGISHGDLLELVFSIAILLGTARLLGEASRRLHQPAVVGEILAGVLLGPSILSRIFPGLGELLLPQTAVQSQLLDVVALLGILFLMIVVGLETDLGLIRARWKVAAGVGSGGLIVPFVLGFALAGFIPGGMVVTERPVVFALFLAVALALSAIPVLARILSDLGLLRRDFGQTALAAGMIDDICGWGLLGVVISLASGSPGELSGLRTLGAIVLFFAATIFLARPAVRWSIGVVNENFLSRDMSLSLVVALAFGWGAFSQWLHLEPILGAFAIGVLFGQSRQLPVDVVRKLESVTNGVFAPIFLATAGLRLRLDALLEPDLLVWTLVVFLVAAVGKLVGGFVGARLLARTSTRDALGYGVALNARGVLGIVVATIGLSMDIFGVEVYSMVVVTSVLTSILAPVGLRWVFGGEPDEKDHEATGPVFRRALLPVRVRDTRGDDVRSLEAAVLGSVCEPGARVTVLSVVDTEETVAGADRYVKDVAALFPADLSVRTRVVRGDAVDVILEVASRGYDLLALGAPEPGPGGEFLFGPLIDDLVRLAPCPSLVFTARTGGWPPRTIMVPTGGTAAAARAAEVAFAMAGPDTTVLLFHVVDPEAATESAVGRQSSTALRMDIGQDIVNELRKEGERMGVRIATEVVMGGRTTPNIVRRASRSVDLLVVGTSARTGTHRLFLGPGVERIIGEAPCSTLIVNA